VDSSQNNEEETNLSQGTKRGGRGVGAYTDKKENKSFLIYKEIQMG
jgi:hypothetical protein